MRVACIVPTYNGALELRRLLKSLETQSETFDLLIVDSSSRDETGQVGRDRADEFKSIPSADFNHGGTRQLMVDSYGSYDIYVFLTQDACLARVDAVQQLIAPFEDPKVGAVCGRQLPHENATLVSQHARFFNYPIGTLVKSESDISRIGIKTAFISNSFSAYSAAALKEVGGFPNHLIFAEDMYVAAKMILHGWKIVYQGDAECFHSHNYTVLEEFERYFDMGVFHAREPWIRQNFGGAGGEGIRYIKSELRFLGLVNLHLWPGALIRNAAKLLGYKLGQAEKLLPIKLKRRMGMYKRYWDGPFASKSH